MENFVINGFRGFRELSLDRLGNVNLIVGKNNVGKTSLLEALYLYGSKPRGRVLAELLIRRGEIARRPPARSHKDDSGAGLTQEQLTRILSIHHAGAMRMFTTTLGPSDGPSFSIQFGWWDGDTLIPADPQDEAHWGEKGRPAWIMRSGEALDRLTYLDELDQYYRYFRPRISGTMMLDSAGTTSDMAMGFEDLKRSGHEYLILESLRIIMPDIQEVFTAGDRRTVWVRTTRYAESVPLQRLGEGMTRVFAMAVAVVQARRRFLLIDEVDNGLHYTVIPKVWSFLMQAAEKFGVQVFATTHSWDCIQGYQWAVQQHPATEAYVIRLDDMNGHVKATTFDRFELGTVVREQIEVR
jgi:predicted ATPase